MKHWLLGALICFCSIPARATYAGKLDFKSDPEAIVFRELNDGMWLMGGQKNLWKLERDGSEVFHVAFFIASRLEGQHPAYGPSLGAPIGAAVAVLTDRVQALGAMADASPLWLKKIASFTSVDAYGGYRPVVGYDDHHWIYGFGGKVRVPISQLPIWSSKEKGGGL